MIQFIAPALGAVWLAAAIGKQARPAPTVAALNRVLAAFGGGDDLAWPSFRLLVAVEFVLGIMLLAGLWRRATLGVSVALLLAFTIWTLLAGRGHDGAGCGCAVRFTWSSAPATFAEEVTRNALLLALSCVLLVLESRGLRSHRLARRTPDVPGLRAPGDLL